MKYRTRTYYTDAQKALMWERWKESWTLHQIAQLFNRSHTSVQGILSRTGGFRPPARSRCNGADAGPEGRDLACRGELPIDSFKCCPARASAIRQRCLGSCASSQAMQTGREQSLGACCDRQASLTVVARTMAGWLKHTYPRDESHHVSHETIYRSLFIQARGALKDSSCSAMNRRTSPGCSSPMSTGRPAERWSTTPSTYKHGAFGDGELSRHAGQLPEAGARFWRFVSRWVKFWSP